MISDKRNDLIKRLCKITGNHSLSEDTFNTIKGLIDHDLRHHTASTQDWKILDDYFGLSQMQFY